MSQYDVISIRVIDDFMIVKRDPTPLMDKLQDIYTIKSISKPDYYLGNDYKKNANGNWTYGCKKYVKEVLVKVESIFLDPYPNALHPWLQVITLKMMTLPPYRTQSIHIIRC